MIKLMMCLRRNPNLSREEFQDYWKNSHAPLFMNNAQVMKAKKYVQSHTLNSPLNDGMKASESELMEVMGSDDMARLGEVLMEDEQKFIDHGASSAFIVTEVEF